MAGDPESPMTPDSPASQSWTLEELWEAVEHMRRWAVSGAAHEAVDRFRDAVGELEHRRSGELIVVCGETVRRGESPPSTIDTVKAPPPGQPITTPCLDCAGAGERQPLIFGAPYPCATCKGTGRV